MAVLAVVVIGAGAWIMLRPHPTPIPAPAPDNTSAQTPVSDQQKAEMANAKGVADLFLDERETGQVDAAWAELADTFQNKVDKAKWRAGTGGFAEARAHHQ